MSTLAAGEVRTRPFNEHRWLVPLASILLHAGLIALLLLIRLPDVRFPKPPKPISVTFVPPSAMPAQQPAPVTIPVPSPAPASVTAAPSAMSQQNDLAAMQNAQAFAQMMQQATEVRPMTVVKPTPAPAAPEDVLHVEGPAPMATIDGSSNNQEGVAESGADRLPQGVPGIGAKSGSSNAGGGIGFAAQGDFNEMLMINIDGIFRLGNDPRMKKFTERLVKCGLGAIDSDNHNWIVELDFSLKPDGMMTDLRVKPPDHPSEEHEIAAQFLMNVINLPGCNMLTSIRKDESWHTGELYLFPMDNHNVPFNLNPQTITMTPLNRSTRLTPQ